jgi:hypothetical protein
MSSMRHASPQRFGRRRLDILKTTPWVNVATVRQALTDSGYPPYTATSPDVDGACYGWTCTDAFERLLAAVRTWIEARLAGAD